MKEGKAYERIRDNIHDKRVATQDPDYMYFATYNKYKDIQELFAKRAKQQPSLGQEAIEQIQTAMTAFIKEFGYLR
ncbi:MAG: hypothetical protein Q8O99_05885 [bacterium]|nr:hypothetical protein [bacterium]